MDADTERYPDLFMDTETFVRQPFHPVGEGGDTAGLDIRLLPLPSSHVRPARLRTRRGTQRLATVLILCLAAVLASLAIGGGVAHASTTPRRMVAFEAARSRAGDPYVYGDAGPTAFDCSGLVYWAYARAGIRLPRDTFGMLAAVASGLLQPTSHPVKGDLAFYGSGHVEFYVRPGHTFGALQTGSPVWWHKWGGWWFPTMYFHIRGSG
jgi:cell wall-associated NlpC family hydrolase